MSTITHRWSREAIIARLAASDSIDRDSTSTLRDRAERRMELLRISSAVDEGRMDATTAEERFETIRTMPVALPLSA